MRDVGVLLKSGYHRYTSSDARASRLGKLCGELKHATTLIDRSHLKQWGKRSSMRFLALGARRIAGLMGLLYKGGRLTGSEVLGIFKAVGNGNIKSHLYDRGDAGFKGIQSLGSLGKEQLIDLVREVLLNPKIGVPKLFCVLLGFEFGSGGMDGNGGVPDLDLLAGIGYHRSPITHSIVAGIIIEVIILAIVDFGNDIFDNLPDEHDPLWDDIALIFRKTATSASVGISSGISWHLFVDAFIQPGSYHDLPFTLSAEAHQALFASNAIAEGQDSFSRYKKI